MNRYSVMLFSVVACGKDNNDSESPSCTDAFYADADADGYGDVSHATTACSIPSGYATTADDCDDTNPAVHPGAVEFCDGIDNDCNGSVDTDAIDIPIWYGDTDADGFGDEFVARQCAQPSGGADVGGDCDDTDPAVNPGAEEICDERDNDCDELVDALDPTLIDGTTWYADVDADGYGDPTSGAYLCTQPEGSIENDTDCDDVDAAIHPDATETCDEIDNDCDGFTDEEDLDAPVVGASNFFADSDGDGLGDAGAVVTACVQPKGYVENEDDCDDTTMKIGAALDYYDDTDGDGYGEKIAHATCTPDADDVLVDGDCAGGYSDIHPGAPEVCDPWDNNCDGLVNEDDPLLTDGIVYSQDADGDGYGDDAATVVSCSDVSGYVATGGDCDDSDASTYPGGLEYCDTIDNDCNSSVDDDVVYVDWYADVDGDGYGDDGDVKNDCIQPSGYVSLPGDCDEGESATNPAATEVCDDGVDNDCDGRACTNFDLSLADAALSGDGGSVSDAGDVAGDGNDDLLVGGNAAAYLVLGAPSGTVDLLSEAQATLVEEKAPAYYFDGRITVGRAGDVDGDGQDDVLVGAPEDDEGGSVAGAAYLLEGPVTGEILLSGADAKLIGASGDYAGHSVAGVGDMDGDGSDDVLIGALNDGGGRTGAAYLVLGGVTGTLDLSTAHATLVGQAGDASGGGSYWSQLAFPVSAAGDVNGDGARDLLVGAPGNSDGGSVAGAAYLTLGPVTGTVDLSLASATLTGAESWEEAGHSVSGGGDVNGDDYDDLLVGAWLHGVAAGAAYLVLGPVTGTFDLASAEAILVGEGPDNYAGVSVAVDGDVDEDGHADLLIGASGTSYLVRGPVEGTLGLEHADVKFDGSGWSVSGGGDFDADGLDDVFIGGWVVYGSHL